jgi:hypothetical protein
MSKQRGRRSVRGLIGRLLSHIPLVLAAGIIAFASLALAQSRAQAAWQGLACVFNAPSGASGLGHIGWGYQSGPNNAYTYGATENGSGNWDVPPGGDNGAWHESGGFPAMLNAFQGARGTGNNHHNTGYYTQYRCQSVANPSVSRADAAVQQAETNGYHLPGKTCLDDTVSIASAYGAQGLPKASDYPEPNNWFDHLTAPWSGPAGL